MSHDSVPASPLRLGDLLIREGLITREQLEQAAIKQKKMGMRLGYCLVKAGFVQERELAQALARHYKLPAVDVSLYEVDPKILKLVPADVAFRHMVLPLKREGRTLTVAVADPTNLPAVVDDLKFITRYDILPVIAGEYTLRTAIERYYEQTDAQLQNLLKDIEDEDLEVIEEEGEPPERASGRVDAAGEDRPGRRDTRLNVKAIDPDFDQPVARRQRAQRSDLVFLDLDEEYKAGEPSQSDELLLGGEQSTDVRFTAYHPTEVRPLDWHRLLVYAHLPTENEEILADSKSRLRKETAAYRSALAEATRTIKRGATITVVPELPGFRFNPPSAAFGWLRDWHCTEFEMQTSPEEPGFAENCAVNGRVAFYVGPVLVGEVRIWAHVSDSVSGEQAMGEEASSDAYRRIFVSYAHKDVELVEALEKALATLGDTFLRDVRTLRSGEQWSPTLLRMIEQADIFQLYWSSAAKQSANVEQEWRHALKQSREWPFVRPLCWERPMPELPDELKELHVAFYDWRDEAPSSGRRF